MSDCVCLSVRLSAQTLGGLEFVQQCLKFDWDVRLCLVKRSSISIELARTVHVNTLTHTHSI